MQPKKKKKKDFICMAYVHTKKTSLHWCVSYLFLINKNVLFIQQLYLLSHCLYYSLQIDLRRAYNCEIMLTKVKIPLSELMVNLPFLFPFFTLTSRMFFCILGFVLVVAFMQLVCLLLNVTKLTSARSLVILRQIKVDPSRTST